MPLLHKKPFQKSEKPPDLRYDTKVFYLEATNEVFLNHEDYFNRVIELNSTVWSCAYTRKTNLTYFEACQSEAEAIRELNHFPAFLEKPILFIVKNFTNRGRFEDLVNDCYNIMKDRYFIGEEVTYTERSKKYPAKVIGNYVMCDPTKESRYDELRNGKGELKEPFLAASEFFRYTLQLLEGPHLTESGEEDSGIRDHITLDKLFRSKHIGSRQKVKLFLKNACYMPWPGDHYVVKEDFLADGIVSTLEWDELLAGDAPICPQTPVLQRGRTPNVMKPGYVEPPKKEKKERRKSQKYEEEEMRSSEEPDEYFYDQDMKPDLEEIGEIPTTSKGSAKRPRKKKVNAEFEEGPTPKKKRVKRKSEVDQKTPAKKKKQGTPKMSEKKKKQIKEQQEQLEPIFKDAEKYSIDLTNIKQESILLNEEAVNKLKESVKEAKEKDKEAQKEERKRKNREKAIYNKKREDLICDDLKPMPKFSTLELPPWMKSEEFSEYMFVMQFFCTFQELLPLKEIRGTTDIYLADIIIAIRCNDPQNSPYADLMRVLLSVRADVADEEDGDDADFSNKDECYLLNNQNCDPGHPVFGEAIRESTELHNRIRKLHGKPVRHLPVDWMTLSEVLRLIFMTSGYYTGLSTHRHRLYTRGVYKGYEDPGFEFRQNHPEILEKLRTQTIYELEPNERLEIMKALILQLLTYSKFRNYIDDQHNEIYELRKEQKKLKLWELTQEQEANAARTALEQNGNKGSPVKASTAIGKRLKSHIKALNEGRRVDREDLDTILLEAVPYTELDLDEIITARSLQKDEYGELMKDLVSKIFETHSMISDIILGKDRAYRKYFVVDNLAAILVETPYPSEDHIGTCEEPSIVEKPELLMENEQQEVFICTGSMDSCKVHGTKSWNRPKWSYISSPEQFEALMKTLNPRGFREFDLTEELNQFKPNLIEILQTTSTYIESGEWLETLMTKAEDPAESWDIDWDEELRDLLLDFEEKVEQGQMGSIAKTFNLDRTAWRENLKNIGDTMMLLNDDIEIGSEIVVSLDDIMKFNEVKKLCVAFFQIVKSISPKFIRHPFTSQHKDENGVPKPTEMFIRWQKALLECESLSSLSLFLSTIEVAIQWGKSRLQGKCKKCRRKGATNDLVLCVECDNCYHLACVNLPKNEGAPSDWKCAVCNANQRKLVNEEKRRTNSTTTANMKFASSGEEEEEFSAAESTIIDTDAGSDSKLFSDPENSDMDSINVIRTLSGRAVKKVQYNDMAKVGKPLKPIKQRKSNGYASSDRSTRSSQRTLDSYDENTSMTEEEEETEVDSELITDEENDRRRSKRTPKRKNFEKLEQVTRHPHTPNIREKMVKIENVLKESMREECSWPFLEAVDRKEVPDYYDVIKRPMFLRAMMNKLKQRVYNEPIEVRHDFNLIIDNCETYNETESEIYRLSRQLYDFVTPRLDAIIDQ